MKLSIISAFEAARLQRRLQNQGPGQGPQVYIDGRFELLDILGEGSFGAVFLARDHGLARRVALKVMALGDTELADREGQALAAVKHPNIVRIFDHGQARDYRWLVLELLEGPNLREWCVDKNPRQILARYLEAGEGLDAAHRRGLVHRDFKPSNVRLDEQGHAKVVDFGLARNLESLEEERGRGPQSAPQGTLVYMAIERLLGKPGDERSDQFAFCVALWEALSGERPFGDERELDARLELLSLPPAGASRIPRPLRKALLRGLSPLPGDRWPTMTRLLEALRVRSAAARWAVSLGTVGMASLVVLGLTTPLRRAAELPSFALPEFVEAEVDAVVALDTHDHQGALNALWSAYPEAVSRDEKRTLRVLAKMAATHFEDEGESTEAFESWWVVTRLSLDLGEEEQVEQAAARVQALVDEL